MKRLVRSIAWGLLLLLLIFCGIIAFAFSPADREMLNHFADAARRWQTSPDFRAVQTEYVSLGVAAMQVRILGAPMADAVLAFRSLPGLPLYLKVSEGSRSHYEDFTRGQLSAYLHLADEQGIADGVGMIEKGLPRDDPAGFLRSFTVPVPVATDAGAIASVQSLLRDVGQAPFQYRSKIGPQLLARIDDPAQMTPAQQHRAFVELDDRLRRTDPELWRTKQVSDFLAGIWAASYGQIYRNGIIWTLRIQRIAQVVFVVLLFFLSFLCYRRARNASAGGRGSRRAVVRA